MQQCTILTTQDSTTTILLIQGVHLQLYIMTKSVLENYHVCVAHLIWWEDEKYDILSSLTQEWNKVFKKHHCPKQFLEQIMQCTSNIWIALKPARLLLTTTLKQRIRLTHWHWSCIQPIYLILRGPLDYSKKMGQWEYSMSSSNKVIKNEN